MYSSLTVWRHLYTVCTHTLVASVNAIGADGKTPLHKAVGGVNVQVNI